MSSTRRGPKRAHTHARRRRAPEPPPEDAFQRAASLFRAVGDVSRLRLLHELGGGERCVSELAESSGTKMSTLSQQLRLLFSERIVTRRRDGKHVYYRLADGHVDALIRAALDHADH
jgi:ArsR family transcriptional regulator